MTGLFYSLQETIEMLNISSEELKVLVGKGQLREFRDGQTLLFKTEEVEALAKSKNLPFVLSSEDFNVFNFFLGADKTADQTLATFYAPSSLKLLQILCSSRQPMELDVWQKVCWEVKQFLPMSISDVLHRYVQTTESDAFSTAYINSEVERDRTLQEVYRLQTIYIDLRLKGENPTRIIVEEIRKKLPLLAAVRLLRLIRSIVIGYCQLPEKEDRTKGLRELVDRNGGQIHDLIDKHTTCLTKVEMAELSELEALEPEALEPEPPDYEALEPEALEPLELEALEPEALELEIPEAEAMELEALEPEALEPLELEALEPEESQPKHQKRAPFWHKFLKRTSGTESSAMF